MLKIGLTYTKEYFNAAQLMVIKYIQFYVI